MGGTQNDILNGCHNKWNGIWINDKVERLSQQQVELEDRIDTPLEMLMDRRIPQQERIISKLQQDEQRLEQVSNELKVLQDTTVPTQKQIQNFRDQIVGELKQGSEKVKTVLHKLLRKVEVEQDGFIQSRPSTKPNNSTPCPSNGIRPKQPRLKGGHS